MKLTSSFLNLPASLLLLLALHPSNSSAIDDEQSPAQQWPYYLPHHVKYWPEDPPHRRRDLEALNQHIIAGKSPIGVKKMGEDEGEKFFDEYWLFDERPDLLPIFDRGLDGSYTNNSMFRLPLALHEVEESGSRRLRSRDESKALAFLEGRGYQCPSGTTSCASIDRPNSCCSSDETCYIITDTGLGDVGCCPNGSSCSSVEIGCGAGYTACADNLGGGCCAAGFVCNGVGCAASPSVTTVLVTNTITITSSQSSSTVIITTTTTEHFTTTYGTTTTTTTGTYTGLQTTLACSSSFRACPVTLGGGCCFSDRECGLTDCPTSPGASSTSSISSTSTTTSSSSSRSSSSTITATTTGVAPVRPTSDTTAEITTSASISTVTGNTCPTGGYYACSAYYPSLSGCCRIGRDCDTTSCPPASTSTTIVSNGVTIAIAAGTGGTTASTTNIGSCATGWQSCAASVGGGCCPSDYVCGTASCTASAVAGSGSATATASGTAVVGKESESKGKRRVGMVGWLGGVLGICWIGGAVMAVLLLW